MSETCFHCGLPVTGSDPTTLRVFGERRSFCCDGCKAICRVIVESGHEDYYRYREVSESQAHNEIIPPFLQRAELYDKPEIQRGFVSAKTDGHEASLILDQIRCAACLWLNERHLRTLDGVLDVAIDYNSHRARVRWDPRRISFSRILKAIAEIGYIAYPYDPAHREALAIDQKRRSIERIIFAAAIGMVVMNFSIASYIFGNPDVDGNYPLWVVIGRWTSLFAVTCILVYPGQEFFAGVWRDLKNARLGMDVPIVIGLLIAWAGSAVATLTQRGEVYYDSIAMFVFLLLVARYRELRGRLAAATSLDRMALVIPEIALRLTASGDEEEIPVVELKPGDHLLVKPGEKVCVDGVIAKGSSSFDESLLTGEAEPVFKAMGEKIMAGSRNGEQPVVVRVTHGRDDSTLSEINRLVEHSLRSRPYYAELAERAAVWFVYVILLVAFFTAAAWMWLDPSQSIQNVVAVLIVTCPCALALATPVAISLSAARFTEIGLLPMRMSALEPLATSDSIVFDKTGTLTQGRPRLQYIESLQGIAEIEIKRIAASLEYALDHPFAKAFRDAYSGKKEIIEELRVLPSSGVEGKIRDVRWRLGKPEFALQAQDLGEPLWRRIQSLRSHGYSVVILADELGPQGLLGLMDPERPGLKDTMIHLRREGIRDLVILSGDHVDNVARLAARLDVEEFLGGLSPRDKLDWIRRAQAQGRHIIMVGDGVNDAPTLAAADVSVSFSQASELARVSSDFVITGTSLKRLVVARRLARVTRRIILQNLSWALTYNFAAIPLAVMGYIPPWGAAIGMALSSLIVVTNALRLKGWSCEDDTRGYEVADTDGSRESAPAGSH